MRSVILRLVAVAMRSAFDAAVIPVSSTTERSAAGSLRLSSGICTSGGMAVRWSSSSF